MLPVYIGFTTSKKKFEMEMKRLNANTYAGCYDKKSLSNATTTCLTKARCGMTIIVALNTKKDPSDVELAGLMAHESLHCLDYILDGIGEDSNAGEFRAYTIQWLVQQFMRIYEQEWKERKKGKKK